MGVEGTLATGRDTGERIVFVDFLRGVASLLVAYFHVQIHVIWQWPDREIDPGSFTYRFIFGNFGLGIFSVAVFFMISGFLIPATLSHPKATLTGFAVKRFFRLYPLYWLSIPAAIALARYETGGRFPLENILWNLTMVQGFAGVPDIIGVYWTLQIEVVFYVICGGLFLVGMLSRRRSLVIVWLLASVACAAARYHTGRKLPVALFLALTLMFLGNLLRHESSRLGRPRQYYGFALLVLAALVPVCWLSYAEQWRTYLVSYCAAILVFTATYLGRQVFEGGGLTTKLSVLLGELSYGTYLFHSLVAAPIVAHLYRHTNVGGVVSMTAGLVATAIVAYVLFRIVERPFIEIGRRVVRRIEPRPKAAAPAPSTEAGDSGDPVAGAKPGTAG